MEFVNSENILIVGKEDLVSDGHAASEKNVPSLDCQVLGPDQDVTSLAFRESEPRVGSCEAEMNLDEGTVPVDETEIEEVKVPSSNSQEAVEQKENDFTSEFSHEASNSANDIVAPILDDVDDVDAIASAEQCLNEIGSILKSNQPLIAEATEKVRSNERLKPGPARRKRKRTSSSSDSDVFTDDDDNDDGKDEDYKPEQKRQRRRTKPPGTPARRPSASGIKCGECKREFQDNFGLLEHVETCHLKSNPSPEVIEILSDEEVSVVQTTPKPKKRLGPLRAMKKAAQRQTEIDPEVQPDPEKDNNHHLQSTGRDLGHQNEVTRKPDQHSNDHAPGSSATTSEETSAAEVPTFENSLTVKCGQCGQYFPDFRQISEHIKTCSKPPNRRDLDLNAQAGSHEQDVPNTRPEVKPNDEDESNGETESNHDFVDSEMDFRVRLCFVSMSKISADPTTTICGICDQKFEDDRSILHHVDDHLLPHQMDLTDRVSLVPNVEISDLERDLEERFHRLINLLTCEGQDQPIGDEKQFVECHICGGTYLDEESLKDHIPLAHAPSEDPSQMSTPARKRGRPRKYPVLEEPSSPNLPLDDVIIHDCPDCEARFFDEELLREHQEDKLKPVPEPSALPEPIPDHEKAEVNGNTVPLQTAEQSMPLNPSPQQETPEKVRTVSTDLNQNSLKQCKVVLHKIGPSADTSLKSEFKSDENQGSGTQERLSKSSSSILEKNQSVEKPMATIRLVPLAKLLKENIPVCNYKNIHTPDSQRPFISESRTPSLTSEDEKLLKSWSMKKVSVVLAKLTPQEILLMTSNRSPNEDSTSSRSKVVHSDFQSLLTTLTRKAKEDIKCGECSRVFDDHAKLLLHVKLVHESKCIVDKKAGAKPKTSASTSSQVKTSAKRERKFLCSVCDKTFTSRGHLKRHSLIFHNKVLE